MCPMGTSNYLLEYIFITFYSGINFGKVPHNLRKIRGLTYVKIKRNMES